MELRACRRSVALTYPIETRAGGPGVFGEEPDLAPGIAFRNVDDERRALVARVFLENAPGRLMRQEEIGLLAREQGFIDRRAPAIGRLFGGPGLRRGLL